MTVLRSVIRIYDGETGELLEEMDGDPRNSCGGQMGDLCGGCPHCLAAQAAFYGNSVIHSSEIVADAVVPKEVWDPRLGF